MGVDNVRLFLPQDPPKKRPGAKHIPYAAPVHGDSIVPDPRRLHLSYIYAAVRGNDHLMSTALQFLGQLHNVGLRASDPQTHGRHTDLHSFLTGPYPESGDPQQSPQSLRTLY